MGLITFINVAIGVSLGGLLYTIWPEHYFSWYPSIPFFYWVMAMAMTFFLDRVKRKNGDVTVTMYMLVRLCKFTLAFVFLWMYAAFVGQQLKTFGFTLMLFYFIYLGLETYILYLFEKKRMKREKGKRMMSTIKDNKYIWIAFWMWLSFLTPAKAASGEIDVQDIVFSHIQDAYTWHITEWNGQEIAIPLPILVKSEERGWDYSCHPIYIMAGRITIIISPGER